MMTMTMMGCAILITFWLKIFSARFVSGKVYPDNRSLHFKLNDAKIRAIFELIKTDGMERWNRVQPFVPRSQTI